MQASFGKFIPDKTFIHNLDPRTKIVSLTMLMISIFILADYRLLAFMSVFLMIVIKKSNIAFKSVIAGIKPLMFMFIFLMLINIFIIKEGEVIFKLPILNRNVHMGAINQTTFIFWRVVLIIMMSIILTSTTNPLTLTLGLEKLSQPLKKVKVPVEVFAMMLSISLRFIPTIFDEVQKIMDAQSSRGLDLQNGKIKEKIKAIIALIIPLLVSSFNKADELALSMESKNYNPDVSRPRYRKIIMSNTDYLIVILMIIYLGIIIYLRRYI